MNLHIAVSTYDMKLTGRAVFSLVFSPGGHGVGGPTVHDHMEPVTHTIPYSSEPGTKIMSVTLLLLYSELHTTCTVIYLP